MKYRGGCFLVLVTMSLLWGGSLHAQDAASDRGEAATSAEGAERTSGPEQSGAEESFAYRLEADQLVVRRGDTEVLRRNLPCDATSLLRHSERLYLACGAEGLYLYDLSEPAEPDGEGYRRFDARVVDLFEAKGRIWVEVAKTEARPLEEVSRRTETPPPPKPVSPEREEERAEAEETAQGEPRPAAERPVGSVVEVRPGTIVIDLGASDGLVRGDRIELFRRKTVRLRDEETTREETIAVGEVVATSANRAQVELGVGEQVAVGRSARPTERALTANALAPPRVPGLSSVDVMVRPFLALGTLGAGTVGHASYRHSFDWPGTLEVQFDPLSFGIAEEANVYPIAGDVSLSYDTTIFRIGLGAGASSIADRVAEFPEDEAQDVAFALTQVARLGARDGLHLRVHNSFVLRGAEFRYGGTSGDIQVSLEKLLHHTWLILRGGGHVAGRAYGEIGLRVLALGNGGEETLFLTPTLGGAGVWGEEARECPEYVTEQRVCSETVSYAGPMVGFGVEWRF